VSEPRKTCVADALSLCGSRASFSKKLEETRLLSATVPDSDFGGPGALRKMRPPVQILKFLTIEGTENRDAEGVEGKRNRVGSLGSR